MAENEKGKLSFVQILISGACASVLVPMLGLQGVTRIIAMVGTFAVVASVLRAFSKASEKEAVNQEQAREIIPDREPMD